MHAYKDGKLYFHATIGALVFFFDSQPTICPVEVKPASVRKFSSPLNEVPSRFIGLELKNTNTIEHNAFDSPAEAALMQDKAVGDDLEGAFHREDGREEVVEVVQDLKNMNDGCYSDGLARPDIRDPEKNGWFYTENEIN